jgi:hypothetical protein
MKLQSSLDSEKGVEEIRRSIKEIATKTVLGKDFTAAIMMQESNGCIRFHTTAGLHPNPGFS